MNVSFNNYNLLRNTRVGSHRPTHTVTEHKKYESHTLIPSVSECKTSWARPPETESKHTKAIKKKKTEKAQWRKQVEKQQQLLLLITTKPQTQSANSKAHISHSRTMSSHLPSSVHIIFNLEFRYGSGAPPIQDYKISKSKMCNDVFQCLWPVRAAIHCELDLAFQAYIPHRVRQIQKGRKLRKTQLCARFLRQNASYDPARAHNHHIDSSDTDVEMLIIAVTVSWGFIISLYRDIGINHECLVMNTSENNYPVKAEDGNEGSGRVPTET